MDGFYWFLIAGVLAVAAVTALFFWPRKQSAPVAVKPKGRMDIAPRMPAEEALHASEARFATVFRTSPISTAITRMSDATILDVNGAWTRVTGISREEAVGHKAAELKCWADLAERAQLIRLMQERGTVQGFECHLRQKSGEARVILMSAEPIEVDGAPCMLSMLLDITERKRAEDRMAESQRRLRALGARLAEVEVQERRRIAAGLHDSVVQCLSLAKLRVQQFRAENPVVRSTDLLDQVQGMVEQAIGESRSLIFDLSLPPLDKLGMEAAVEWLAEKVRTAHGLAITVDDDGQPKPLSEASRRILYGAVRELLQNVVRHARATSAKVSLRRSGSNIEMDVTDDGVGFDHVAEQRPPAADGGFGLFHIHERIDYLGGSVNISSRPGGGAQVTLLAPLDENEQSSVQK